MLHHRRQLDCEGLREFAHRGAILALEPGEDCTPGRVNERREGPVKLRVIVHNVVKFWPDCDRCQPPRGRLDSQAGAPISAASTYIEPLCCPTTFAFWTQNDQHRTPH